MQAKIVKSNQGANWKMLVAVLTATTALSTVLMQIPANAQSASRATAAASSARNYAIPAGPLANALNRFADISQLQLLYSGETTRGLRTSGLNGTYTSQQALAQLLSGTGLTFRFSGGSNVTIERPGAPVAVGAAPSGAISLDTIDVQGASSSDPGRTEGTGSYTPSVTATATRFQLTPRETPQSISVITRQQIEDFNLATVDDVMNRTPGITTVTYENERVEYYARGFAVRNIQIDGMQGVYDSGYPAGETLSDMAMYDRVEVLKGANGLLTNSGDPSATVNMIRKRPTRTFQGNTILSAGSWNTYRGQLDLSGPLNQEGTIRGRFVAAHQDRQSYLDHFSNKGSLFYGIIEADLTPDTLLTVAADYQRHVPKGSSYGGIPLIDSNGNFNEVPRSFNPGARWSSWEQYSYSVFSSLEHRFDNDWRVKLQVRRAINGYDAPIGAASIGYPNPADGSGVFFAANSFVGKTQQDVMDIYATGPVHLFGRKHDLVLGGLVSRRHWINESADPEIGFNTSVANFYNWNGDFPKPGWQNETWGGTLDQIAHNRAAYAAVRLNPHDRLKLIAGTRLARYESVQNFFWNPVEERLNKSVVVPYFGATLDLNEHISLYASHTGIFLPQYVQNELGVTLPPQEGTNNEVGLKSAFFDGRLNASAAYFHVNQDNFAVPSGGRTPSGTPAYRAVDGVVTKGFELEISGQLSPQWQIQAGFTHKISRRENIKVGTLTPENQFTFYTTYKLDGALDGLTVGGGARWQDITWGQLEIPLWSGNYQTHVVAGYWLADLMASYKFTDNLSATLNVRNLFDKKYYSMLDFYSVYVWGAPRSVFLNVTYKF